MKLMKLWTVWILLAVNMFKFTEKSVKIFLTRLVIMLFSSGPKNEQKFSFSYSFDFSIFLFSLYSPLTSPLNPNEDSEIQVESCINGINIFPTFQNYEYFKIFTLFVFILLISFLLFGIAFLLSLTTIKDSEKLSQYECGFEPFDEATRHPFDVHFYVVGILFLIFDVEIALLFPWVLGLNNIGWQGFCSMFLFLFILAIGFFYEWHRGALVWPHEQFKQGIEQENVVSLYRRGRSYYIDFSHSVTLGFHLKEYCRIQKDFMDGSWNKIRTQFINCLKICYLLLKTVKLIIFYYPQIIWIFLMYPTVYEKVSYNAYKKKSKKYKKNFEI
jgi:NADH-quinone oxidoreductase subunit A